LPSAVAYAVVFLLHCSGFHFSSVAVFSNWEMQEDLVEQVEGQVVQDDLEQELEGLSYFLCCYP
jgi:hypothetical protein